VEGKRKQLKVEQITADPRCQQRELFEVEWIADAVEWLESGGGFPAVTVFFDGATHWLADGFVRTAAYRQHGVKMCEVDVYAGSLCDAVMYSCGANVDHGNRRKSADVKKAVVRLLSEDDWGRPSNSKIAVACKVSLSTVQRIKAEMVEAAESPADDDEAKPTQLFDLNERQRHVLTELAETLTPYLVSLENVPGKVKKKVQAALDEISTVMGAES